MSMNCKRINVSLPEGDLTALDALAEHDAGDEDANRSKTVRRLIRDERRRRETAAASKPMGPIPLT